VKIGRLPAPALDFGRKGIKTDVFKDNTKCLTWNSTATMCREAEQGRMVASGRRRPARALRQYQKKSECHGKRLVLKYGSPIRTEICERPTLA